MGWLRLVGSLKPQASFAEYSLFYRALLQKRPMILRSLLIVDPSTSRAVMHCQWVAVCAAMHRQCIAYDSLNMNESCDRLRRCHRMHSVSWLILIECDAWVMSHIRMSHVTFTNEPCHIHCAKDSALCAAMHCVHNSFIFSASCHTYERAMSHLWMSHVTYERVMSHIRTRHFTYMNESCCVALTRSIFVRVCVFIAACVSVSVPVSVPASVSALVFVCVLIPVSVSASASASVSVSISIFASVCVSVAVPVCVYLCMCVCVCVIVCMCGCVCVQNVADGSDPVEILRTHV